MNNSTSVHKRKKKIRKSDIICYGFILLIFATIIMSIFSTISVISLKSELNKKDLEINLLKSKISETYEQADKQTIINKELIEFMELQDEFNKKIVDKIS